MTKQKGFFWGTAVLPAGAFLVLSACLNPAEFNPQIKLNVAAEVSGEISVDQLNSSEVQVRNHTKSIDIVDVKFFELESARSGAPAEILTAQISGAPIHGTQESIFLQPWKKYRIDLKWREASPKDGSPGPAGPFTRAHYPDWDWGDKKNPSGSLTIEHLPRGKYVIHVYRKDNGDIGIQIEDDWANELDGNDHHNDGDFVLTVQSPLNVDLSGMSISLNIPPTGIMADFSNEVKNLLNQANINFDKISKSIDNLRSFPKNYGFVIVKNRTSRDIIKAEFSGLGSRIVSTGVVGGRDESAGMLMRRGTWQVNVEMADGTVFGPKNVNVLDNQIVFVHLSEDANGSLQIDVNNNATWNYAVVVKTLHEPDKYGSLVIQNMTAFLIEQVVFYRTDVQSGFRIEDISKKSRYSLNSAEKTYTDKDGNTLYVLAGNYKIMFKAGGIWTPEPVDFAVKSNTINNGGRNIWTITAVPEKAALIQYTVAADGAVGTTSTRLTFTFASDPGSLDFSKFIKVAGKTTFDGTVTRKSATEYEVPITVKEMEKVTVKVDQNGVDPGDREAQVYFRAQQPSQPKVGRIILYGAEDEIAVTTGFTLFGGTTNPAQIKCFKNAVTPFSGIFCPPGCNTGVEALLSAGYNDAQAAANYVIFDIVDMSGVTAELVRIKSNGDKTVLQNYGRHYERQGRTGEIIAIKVSGTSGTFKLKAALQDTFNNGTAIEKTINCVLK